MCIQFLKRWSGKMQPFKDGDAPKRRNNIFVDAQKGSINYIFDKIWDFDSPYQCSISDILHLLSFEYLVFA